MRRAVALALTAALVALAACSGDDGGDDAAEPTTSTTEVTFTGDADSPFCALLRENADNTGVEAPTTPAETEAAYSEVIAQLQATAEGAPPELEEDTALVLAGMAAFVDALRAVDFDVDALATSPQGPEVSAAINDPAFAAAGVRIDAYKDQVCKL